MLSEARKNDKCPKWMGAHAWEGLQKHWGTGTYKETCEKAKQNRASAKGGSLHTGGSISITEHRKRMVSNCDHKYKVYHYNFMINLLILIIFFFYV